MDMRERLSFLPFMRPRGPSTPERRAMRDYLVQANAIIARVLPARKTWLVELNRLVVLVQEDKVPTANREAGETFRTFDRTYVELRDALARLVAPPDAAECHELLLAW